MALKLWTSIFNGKIEGLSRADSWELNFCQSIVADSPGPGWKQYIRHARARFTCSVCSRDWTSHQALVLFNMRLSEGKGTVKVKRYRENCTRCPGPMETPVFSKENINTLLDKLIEKIRQKCYGKRLGKTPAMPLDPWASIFNGKIEELNRADSWELKSSQSIVAESPGPGWKEYIRHARASFKCSKCKRGWRSNQVMVLFHMRLAGRKGTVKVRRFRQNCKRCAGAPMETPEFSTKNINALLDKLMEKIRQRCYGERLGKANKPQDPSFQSKGPHEAAHCEACKQGVCNAAKDDLTARFKGFSI